MLFTASDGLRDTLTIFSYGIRLYSLQRILAALIYIRVYTMRLIIV